LNKITEWFLNSTTFSYYIWFTK